MEIIPVGDSALVIRLPTDFATDPQSALREVLTVRQRLEAAEIPGVVDLVPSYTTIGLFYDPAAIIAKHVDPRAVFHWISKHISDATQTRGSIDPISSNVVEIPVCYHPEFALDLDQIVTHTGLESAKIVDLHCAGEYLVHCVGFTPGFPYLSGLPTALATPRRATPRTEVPAGSVAIGGIQTGIYPQASPGGWNVIGRTPLRLFDIARQSPSLLAAGDRVRFRKISRAEFDMSVGRRSAEA